MLQSVPVKGCLLENIMIFVEKGKSMSRWVIATSRKPDSDFMFQWRIQEISFDIQLFRVQIVTCSQR